MCAVGNAANAMNVASKLFSSKINNISTGRFIQGYILSQSVCSRTYLGVGWAGAESSELPRQVR